MLSSSCQVLQHFQRGEASGAPMMPRRMSGRAAHVRFWIGVRKRAYPARTQEEKLFERKLALKNISFAQPTHVRDRAV